MPFEFLGSVLRRVPFLRRKAPPRACFVFLLREPSELPLPVVQLAATRAWNIEFDGRGTGGNHVMRMGVVAIIQLGPEMLHVLTSPKPYGKEFSSRRMPKLPSGPAWAHHRGFLCFDNLTAGSMHSARFQQLGKLAAELLNANCIAVFFPHLNVVIPHSAALPTRFKKFNTWDDLILASDPPVPLIEDDD
jgi:hypothetical protein